jgi:hypothetical protein
MACGSANEPVDHVSTRERAVEDYRREGETLKLFTTFVSDETISHTTAAGFRRRRQKVLLTERY